MTRSCAVGAALVILAGAGCSGGADTGTTAPPATESVHAAETGSEWTRRFVDDFADGLVPGARIVWSQALGFCSPVDAPESGAAVEVRLEWDDREPPPTAADVAVAAAGAGTEPRSVGEDPGRYLVAPQGVSAEARIQTPSTDEDAGGDGTSSVVVQVSVHDVDGADEAEAAGWQWGGYVCDVGWPPPPAAE